jgi:hypothetical protein
MMTTITPGLVAPGLPPNPAQILALDPAVFGRQFGQSAFRISHNLANHDLFALGRLLELSRSLPESNVKYNSGRVRIGDGIYRGASTGLSIQETIRQIEECGAWMVLKFVEHDPEYRRLMDACLDEVAALFSKADPGMCRREAFIFISSPGSITPYHIDPEYNFLLQIRGAKTMNVLDGADRSILSEPEIENFFSGRKHQIHFDDAYLEKATSFTLEPGAGVHVPPAAPHWVQNGPEVCVSFSITFRTPALERRALIYGANSYLRRLGLKPRPPGSSQLTDSAKYHAHRVFRRTASVARPIFRSSV